MAGKDSTGMSGGERIMLVVTLLLSVFACLLGMLAFFRGSPTANSIRPVVQEVLKDELGGGVETPYGRATREMWDLLRPFYEDAGVSLTPELQMAVASGGTPESMKATILPLLELLRERFEIEDFNDGGQPESGP